MACVAASRTRQSPWVRLQPEAIDGHCVPTAAKSSQSGDGTKERQGTTERGRAGGRGAHPTSCASGTVRRGVGAAAASSTTRASAGSAGAAPASGGAGGAPGCAPGGAGPAMAARAAAAAAGVAGAAPPTTRQAPRALRSPSHTCARAPRARYNAHAAANSRPGALRPGNFPRATRSPSVHGRNTQASCTQGTLNEYPERSPGRCGGLKKEELPRQSGGRQQQQSALGGPGSSG